MAQMQQGGQQRCGNPGCHCNVQSGKQYCSSECERQARAGTASSSCGCHHDECAKQKQ